MSTANATSVDTVSVGEAKPVEGQEPKETKTDTTLDAASKEAPKPESTPEAKKEEPKQVDRFAPKFAALSRKEKELRQKQQEWEAAVKAREEEMSRRQKELEEQGTQAKTREQLKRENILKYLEAEGLSYEEITKAVLSDGKPDPEKQKAQVIAELQNKIDKLNSRLEEKEKREKEEKEAAEKASAERRVEERISAFKGEIQTFLEKADDKYELLRAGAFSDITDPVQTIYDVILEHHEDTKAKSPDKVGEILEIEQAADLVEQYLEKQATELAKTKKLQSKFSPAPPTEEKKTEEKKSDTASSESPKTLENAHSSTIPSRQGGKLDDDELLAQAASLIRWNKGP